MTPLQRALWEQTESAAITLRSAIAALPEEMWREPCGTMECWRAGFHALFFLDLYSAPTVEAYAPPPGIETYELDEGGEPSRVLDRKELLAYADTVRGRAQEFIESLELEDLERTSGIPWLGRRGLSVVEQVLYNLRHAQHHAAQLNLVLRQSQDQGSAWVFRSEA